MLNESSQSSRYSIEVNYRTSLSEVMDNFARLSLGYVSAALKQADYNVKTVLDQKPYRITVSSKNFEDGEWVALVSFNEKVECFVLSKGFYNKAKKTVSVLSNQSCVGKSASEVYREVVNLMFELKKKDNQFSGQIKGIDLKTGPKQGSMRPGQGLLNKGRPERHEMFD
jgi:hypothetical protein